MIGTSEGSVFPTLIPLDNKDWAYFEWVPTYGLTMRAMDNDLDELVISRTAALRDYHAIFHSLPDKEEGKSKDTYTRHPHKPGLWKFHGRLEDMITFRTGGR